MQAACACRADSRAVAGSAALGPVSALERTGIRARQRDLYQRPRTSDHQVVAQVAHEYPPLVTALLQSGLPVRTVLDAGANAGFSTNTLATGLPESYVVGLEPDADNYAMLRFIAGSRTSCRCAQLFGRRDRSTSSSLMAQTSIRAGNGTDQPGLSCPQPSGGELL